LGGAGGIFTFFLSWKILFIYLLFFCLFFFFFFSSTKKEK
jgi:hypothetical protein